MADSLFNPYRVTGRESIEAVVWFPAVGASTGATDGRADSEAVPDLSHQFASQLGGYSAEHPGLTDEKWRVLKEHDDPIAILDEYEILTAEQLSTRYYDNLADARVELGNVPMPNIDEFGIDRSPVVDDSVYVGVESAIAAGNPSTLIDRSMFVVPDEDWELIRTVLSPASRIQGGLPPIDWGTEGGEFLAWEWDIPRLRALLLDAQSAEAKAVHASLTRGAAETVASTVTRTSVEILPAVAPSNGDRRGSKVAVVHGITITGESSTVSILASADFWLFIVRTGSLRTAPGILRRLTSDQFGEIYAKPRR